MTGATRRSASCATAAPASAASAPPPAQISGRRERSSSSAARARWSSSGAGGCAARRLGLRAGLASAPSRSVGISTYTGRRGGVIATRAAASIVAPASSALPRRKVRLTTGSNIAAWSVASWSTPRQTPGRRRRCGMSVATTSTGWRLAHASPTAPSVLAAPGPVVVSATPSRPVARV